MRRGDRLFQIVLKIGHGNVTAKQLAQSLGIATRTVYRDVRDLVRSGVPIEGEAGVGYRLRRGHHVPPLMFTDEELQALHLGVSILGAWADAGLADAAQRVLAKVNVVLPDSIKPKLAYGAIIVPGGHVPVVIADHLSVLRGAVNARRKVNFNYPRPFAERSRRTVWPIVLTYWGGCWTLGAWCEYASDFRTFRLDNMVHVDVSVETYLDKPGLRLSDYLAAAPEHDAVLNAVVDSLRVREPLWPTARVAFSDLVHASPAK
jgi:predicted DNA-binding transcriptional regulator YafY